MTRRGVPNPNAIKAMTENRVIKANVRIASYMKTGIKVCRHCKLPKPLSEFEDVIRKGGTKGFSSWCKGCGVVMRRDRRQKEHYNLSPEDSEKIVVYQNRLCAICKAPMERFKRALATDHDHKTGLIRGKLCWFCNKLIAIAQDNPERLLAAAIYLLAPPAVAALGDPRFGLPGQAGTKKQRKLAKKMAKNPAPPPTFVSKDPVAWLKSILEELKNPPARQVIKDPVMYAAELEK